jgi:hypothetical protein
MAQPAGIAPVYGDRNRKKRSFDGRTFYPEWLKNRMAQIVEWKLQIAKGVYGKDKPFLLKKSGTGHKSGVNHYSLISRIQ